MSLPADVCRCHDSKCRERNSCLRWIERGAWDLRSRPSCWAPDKHGNCRWLIPNNVINPIETPE